MPRYVQLGADGNLYFELTISMTEPTDCNLNVWVVGINAQTGAVRFATNMGPMEAPPSLQAYSNGLIFRDKARLEYLDYAGIVQKTVNLPNDAAGDGTLSTMLNDGAVSVSESGNVAVLLSQHSDACSNPNPLSYFGCIGRMAPISRRASRMSYHARRIRMYALCPMVALLC